MKVLGSSAAPAPPALDDNRRADPVRSARRGTRRTAARGFTLIELIFGLTIAAALIAIGMPKVVAANSRRTIASAADQFVGAHALARATAMRFGREARLHIDTIAGRFFVDVDTSGTGKRGPIGFPHNVGSSGVKIASSDTVLCFNPRGLKSAGGPCIARVGALTFTWSRDEATPAISLQITPLGKVLR